jgi:hypothetical protein
MKIGAAEPGVIALIGCIACALAERGGHVVLTSFIFILQVFVG